MTRIITPIILVAIAIGLFILYIQPTYAEVGELKAQQEQFDRALERSRELQEVRDELLSRFNTFDPDDLERLRKILPDAVDNVRLILEIDNIAARYGVPLSEISVETQEQQDTNEEIAVAEEKPYQSVILGFTFATNYDLFKSLLDDLQSSLRLVDIESVSFRTAEDDVTQYSVKIRTYWLP